jgi:CSLREA domain-containing protein
MQHFKGLSLILMVALCLAMPGRTSAAPQTPLNPIQVNTAIDEFDTDPADDHCSLREAIESANTDTAISACAAGNGADVIQLSGIIYYMELTPGGTDSNTDGDFDILTEITIDGIAPNQTIIEGRNSSGTSLGDRVFHVSAAGRLTLLDLAVQYGNSSGDGGGILTEGGDVILESVSLLHNSANGYGGAYATLSTITFTPPGPRLSCNVCYIQYNTASGAGLAGGGGGVYNHGGRFSLTNAYFEENTIGLGGGGAIFSDSAQSSGVTYTTFLTNHAPQGYGGAVLSSGNGSLSIFDSIFQENTAKYQGGAIANDYNTNLQLSQVEMTGNSVTTWGGGGLINYGFAAIINSTIYDNHAVTGGGGILGFTGSTSLSFSTVAFNSDTTDGATGDGLALNPGGIFVLTANIIAWNGESAGSGNNCSGAFTSYGYNIETGNTCSLGSADLIDTNPMLDVFGQHGSINGSRSYSLFPSSPARDFYTIDTGCPGRDQRGVSRPLGFGPEPHYCDAGAFEFDPAVYGQYMPLVIRP